MKTTLELPDDLVRQIEQQATLEGCKPNEFVAEVLSAKLAPVVATNSQLNQVVAKRLPRIKARPASPENAKTLSQQEWCDWLKVVEQQHELERYERALGHQYVDRVDG